MKYLRSIILLPLLFLCGSLFAANPSYKNFDTNFFTLLPDGSTITIKPGAFQSSTSGIPVLNGIGFGTILSNATLIGPSSGSTNFTGIGVFTGTFNGTAAALTNIPDANTLYVATNGNNSSAKVGRPDLPWLTVSNAVAIATNGQTVKIGYGKFSDFTNLNPGAITIAGMGISNTILSSLERTNASTWTYGLSLTNGLVIRDLTIQFNDPTLVSNSSVMYPIVFDGGILGSAVGVKLERVQVNGNTDCIFHNSGYLEAEINECVFYTHWDAFNSGGQTGGGEITYRNPTIRAIPPFYPAIFNQGRGIKVGGAYENVYIHGGSIVISNANPALAQCVIAYGGGHAWISGSTYLENTSNGVPHTLTWTIDSQSSINSDYWPYLPGDSAGGEVALSDSHLAVSNNPASGDFLASDGLANGLHYWTRDGGKLTNTTAYRLVSTNLETLTYTNDVDIGVHAWTTSGGDWLEAGGLNLVGPIGGIWLQGGFINDASNAQRFAFTGPLARDTTIASYSGNTLVLENGANATLSSGNFVAAAGGGRFSSDVVATNGYGSKSNVFFLAPTNLPSVGHVIVATGTGSPVPTKWAPDATGGTGSTNMVDGTNIYTVIVQGNMDIRTNLTVEGAGTFTGTGPNTFGADTFVTNKSGISAVTIGIDGTLHTTSNSFVWALTVTNNTEFQTNDITSFTPVVDMLQHDQIFISATNFSLAVKNIPKDMTRYASVIITNSGANASTIAVTLVGFAGVSGSSPIPGATFYVTNLTAKHQIAELDIKCRGPGLTNAVVTHFYDP
jgi:hypothetical protein